MPSLIYLEFMQLHDLLTLTHLHNESSKKYNTNVTETCFLLYAIPNTLFHVSKIILQVWCYFNNLLFLSLLFHKEN